MSAEIRPMKSSAELALADAFSALKPTLPGDGSIVARRDAAFQRFASAGLPHRRVEEWKYTDLRALWREAKPLAGPPDAQAKRRAAEACGVLGKLDCRRMVFVDGAFVADLSDLADLEPGVTIGSMAAALAAGEPLVLAHLGKVAPVSDPAVEMNTAFMGDGALIHIAAGTTVARPLHLVYVTVGEKPAAMFTRSLVVVDRAARVTLVESHDGAGSADYQVNTALELVVDEAAAVEHVKVAHEGPSALHVASLMARLGARASFNCFSFVTGGAVLRNQMFVCFAGAETVAKIGGANLLSGRQHVDTALIADHAAPGCQSRELFKSVLDGEARGVFQGKITVRPDAQRTDAKMMAQALVLSAAAEAIHKPELEIFADDVQCGHGATTGALDGDLKFYLMARGIPAKEAEALLIEAFVGGAIETIAHDGIRAALLDAAGAWLAARG